MQRDYIVDTEYGKVRGFVQTSALNLPYIRFLGIPYATPPVGNLRFKSPMKPSSWAGKIINAGVEPNPCAGRNNYIKKFVGSEDCLYLNIFTNNLSPDKPYGVMVHIHGGGHCGGSSSLFSYSPDYIMLSNVVLVAFNFRVGPLGFLSLKDKSLNVPGNAGLKDQQLAMKFVKNNIHHFGGDPNNITLFGHSSGGTSVSLHCIAESSRGLFHKAIIMSGSSLAYEGNLSTDGIALALAKKLGFNGENENENEILSFLEKADVLLMAEAQHTLINKLGPFPKPFTSIAFGPCIEPYESDSAFMLKPPIKLLSSAWSNDIDIMFGGTADEGLDAKKDFEKNASYEVLIPNDIKRVSDDQMLRNFAARLKDFYSKYSSSEWEAYLKLNGDRFRWLDIQRLIHARQNSGKKGRTFLYRFAVDSPTQNYYRNRWNGPDSTGVSHADELCYLWKNGLGGVPSHDSIEFTSIMRFTSLLTSFAIAGDPNVNVLNSELNAVVWEHVKYAPYKGLNIGKTLEFRTLEESQRLTFLETLYKELSIPLY